MSTGSILPNSLGDHQHHHPRSLLWTRRWAIHLPDSKSQSTSSSQSMEFAANDDDDEEEVDVYDNGTTDSDGDNIVPVLIERNTKSSNALESTLAASATRTPSIDILLNVNAKGVTPSVIQEIESVVARHQQSQKSSRTTTTTGRMTSSNIPIRIHTTRTIDQAMQAVKDIVQAQSTLVIPIGGDGTLTALLQLLAEELGLEQAHAHAHSHAQESNVNPPTAAATDMPVPSSSPSSSPPAPRRLPDIAYIPMGTGNALGSVVGCRPPQTLGRLQRWIQTVCRRPSFLGGSSRKLQRLSETMTALLELAETGLASSQDTMVDIVELPLLQVTTKIHSNTTTGSSTTTPTIDGQEESQKESSLCFFAGVGFDSLMLQDYHDLQDWTSSLDQPHRRLFKESFSSVLGYCVALVTRTLPQCLLDQKHLIQVEVSTRHPQTTVWIDHRRGDVVRPVLPASTPTNTASTTNTNANTDTLLYRGTAGIVAVGSAPFYGGGLRLFPFARMTTEGMQLRIGRIHPLRGTMNIPKIFEGSYRDTRDDAFGCLDFMGSQFSIKILAPTQGYPVQHSGDFIGTTTEVDFAMIPQLLQPVRFVTLLPPRLILENDI